MVSTCSTTRKLICDWKSSVYIDDDDDDSTEAIMIRDQDNDEFKNGVHHGNPYTSGGAANTNFFLIFPPNHSYEVATSTPTQRHHK